MNPVTPTRSAVLELREERRALQEGHAFLDEKCLLLAAEMVRGLRRYEALRHEFRRAQQAAQAALEAALARHGLQGLQVYAPALPAEARLEVTSRPLLGIALQDAALAGPLSAACKPLQRSPEAEACREAFAELLRGAAALAALAGNLERLLAEYRRASRRARALQDVLLPELAQTLHDAETRIEEMEQEEAVWFRRRA
jgi:V/A-type H+-transporting ATPase subunit D